MQEPVSISVALGGLLTTGVALASIYVPDLTREAQIAIIAFGNAVILTGVAVWARMQVTPLANPTLPQGTSVNVTTPKGQPDTVVTV